MILSLQHLIDSTVLIWKWGVCIWNCASRSLSNLINKWLDEDIILLRCTISIIIRSLILQQGLSHTCNLVHLIWRAVCILLHIIHRRKLLEYLILLIVLLLLTELGEVHVVGRQYITWRNIAIFLIVKDLWVDHAFYIIRQILKHWQLIQNKVLNLKDCINFFGDFFKFLLKIFLLGLQSLILLNFYKFGGIIKLDLGFTFFLFCSSVRFALDIRTSFSFDYWAINRLLSHCTRSLPFWPKYLFRPIDALFFSSIYYLIFGFVVSGVLLRLLFLLFLLVLDIIIHLDIALL